MHRLEPPHAQQLRNPRASLRSVLFTIADCAAFHVPRLAQHCVKSGRS